VSDQRYILNGVTFLWDVNKAEMNLEKHSVHFEEACQVFFDPFFILRDASRHYEKREGLIGYSESGRLLFVVYAEREGDAYRIISAKEAEKEHRREYENY